MDKYRLYLDGVLHVGANDGSEAPLYYAAGAATAVFVEPVDAVFQQLCEKLKPYPGYKAVQAVCSSEVGQRVSFNVAEGDATTSSLLPFADEFRAKVGLKYVATQEMVTTTVDELVAQHCPDANLNLMVIDTQGWDMKVLQGARQVLQRLEAVYVEIANISPYVGGSTFDDIHPFMLSQGFKLYWMECFLEGWGDAFYLRDLKPPMTSPNLALGRPATMSSSHPASAGANGGNDGRITGYFGFCTGLEDAPWWQVDLGTVRPIREVRVYNRLRWEDLVADRARHIAVLLSEDGESWREVYYHRGRPFGGLLGKPLRVFLDDAARFVRLQLKQREYLHLDEVEVY
jgi:FkbM family methyltransferase